MSVKLNGDTLKTCLTTSQHANGAVNSELLFPRREASLVRPEAFK